MLLVAFNASFALGADAAETLTIVVAPFRDDPITLIVESVSVLFVNVCTSV